MHPFLADQIATNHVADLRTEAAHRRVLRDLRPDRSWRFWRRPRSGPPPPAVIAITRRDDDRVNMPESTLRPVA